MPPVVFELVILVNRLVLHPAIESFLDDCTPHKQRVHVEHRANPTKTERLSIG